MEYKKITIFGLGLEAFIFFLAAFIATLLFSLTNEGWLLNLVVFSAGCTLTLLAIYDYHLSEDDAKDISGFKPLSNAWTSLGILGTFITLIITVLSELGDDKGLAEIAENTNFIKGFVTAFTTSIIGILGSLGARFLLLDKTREYESLMPNYERKTERYYLAELLQAQKDGIDKTATGQTKLKYVLDDILKELKATHQVGKETQKEVVQFATAVQTLAPNITQLLEETLGGIQDKLQTSIDNMSSTAGENIKIAIDALANELKTQLTSTNTVFQQQQNDLVQKNNDALVGMTEEMKKQLLAMSTSMKEQAEKDSEAFASLMKLQREETKKQMETFSEQMESQMTTAQEQTEEQFSSLFKDIQGNIKELQTTATDTIKGYTDGLETSFNAMKEIVENMQEHLSNVDIHHKDLYTKFGDINIAFDNTVSKFEGFVKQSNLAYTTIENFADTVEEFRETLTAVTELEHKYMENVTKIRTLTKVLEDMTNSIGEVEQSMKNSVLLKLNK